MTMFNIVGWESQEVEEGVYFGSPAGTIVTGASARNGGAALEKTQGEGPNFYGRAGQVSPGSPKNAAFLSSILKFGIGLNIITNNSGDILHDVFTFIGGTIENLKVKVQNVSNGVYELLFNDRVGGTMLTSANLNVGTWYFIEIEMEAGGGGASTCIIDIEGTEVFNSTTENLGTDSFVRLEIDAPATSTRTARFDDLWIGDENESFLGVNARIEKLAPTGDGTNVDWDLSTGTVHKDVQDEAPPNDDTDYATTSDNPEAEQLAVEDSSVYSMDDTGTFVAVKFHSYISKAVSQALNAQILGRANATDVVSATVQPTQTDYEEWGVVLTQAPGPTAWTAALVDGCEPGVSHEQSQSREARVTAQFCTVLYVDAAAADSLPKPLLINQAVNRAATY